MTIDALTGVLVIPAIAAALLAVLPGYRITARGWGRRATTQVSLQSVYVKR